MVAGSYCVSSFEEIVSHIDKHQLSQKVKFVRASLAQKVSVWMV